MRDYLFSSLVPTPAFDRPNYAIPEPTRSISEPIRGERPMPAKPSDITALRGILYFLDNPPRFQDPVIRRAHADALRRMIADMEKNDAPSPVWWLAGALKKSYKKVGNIYIVTDRDLATWTLDKLFEMFPDDESEQ